MHVLAIRAQFRLAADNAEFPDFDNGYYYPVDARLRLLRDAERSCDAAATRRRVVSTWIHSQI